MSSSIQSLILLLLLCSLHALSQNQLKYDNVLFDKKFSCNDGIQMEANTNSLYTKKIQTVCESKNEFELRFYVGHRPSSGYDLFVLTCNDSGWSLVRYFHDWKWTSHSSFDSTGIQKLKPKYGFDTLFIKLKKNNVFTLPDQRKLKFKGDVDDGNIYFLTYKVKDKFRCYSFENPYIYREENKRIKEFVNYVNIVSIFYEDLINE